MSEAAQESEGLKRTIKDLTAGAAGGIAQVLLGQSTRTFLVSYLETSAIGVQSRVIPSCYCCCCKSVVFAVAAVLLLKGKKT